MRNKQNDDVMHYAKTITLFYCSRPNNTLFSNWLPKSLPCVTSNKFSEGYLSARLLITSRYLALARSTVSCHLGSYIHKQNQIQHRKT